MTLMTPCFFTVQREVEDRQQFLKDMETLGQGKKYSTVIATEISQVSLYHKSLGWVCFTSLLGQSVSQVSWVSLFHKSLGYVCFINLKSGKRHWDRGKNTTLLYRRKSLGVSLFRKSFRWVCFINHSGFVYVSKFCRSLSFLPSSKAYKAILARAFLYYMYI